MNKIEQILIKINPNIDLNNADFISSGLLDSFSLMSLIEELENEFRINIFGNEIDIECFTNINSISEFIKQKGVDL